MTIFLCIVFFCIGVAVGKFWAWSMYHQPDIQEEYKLKTAKLRAERAGYEATEEKHRGEIDDDLERRIRRRES